MISFTRTRSPRARVREHPPIAHDHPAVVRTGGRSPTRAMLRALWTRRLKAAGWALVEAMDPTADTSEAELKRLLGRVEQCERALEMIPDPRLQRWRRLRPADRHRLRGELEARLPGQP